MCVGSGVLGVIQLLVALGICRLFILEPEVGGASPVNDRHVPDPIVPANHDRSGREGPHKAAPAESEDTPNPTAGAPAVRLTVDTRHDFRGIWTDGGVCRVRIYEDDDRPPVVVLTEVAENRNTSITNLIEHLAYDVVRAHLPHRLEAIPPAIVLEHYPVLPGRRRGASGTIDVDRVTFATWRPVAEWLGGVRRVRFGEPSWARLDPDELRRLIGNPAELED
jgi:hypothetical protein